VNAKRSTTGVKSQKFMGKNRTYEVLAHPADLKIRAFGKNLAEVFSNLLEGMFKSCRPELIDEKVIRKIKIKAREYESLLVNFLSEALSLSDINNEVYFKAKFNEFTDKYLQGEIKGYKIKSLELGIKGVTWHDLKIEKKNSYWQATVLFDI